MFFVRARVLGMPKNRYHQQKNYDSEPAQRAWRVLEEKQGGNERTARRA
jgi:hypothetical protein